MKARSQHRIIFSVTNDLSYDQRMIRICGSLARAGYRVLLVGRQRKNSRPLIDRDFAQHRLSCFFERGKLFYLEYHLRLFFFLWRQSFTMLCAIDLDTLLPMFYWSRWRGVPLVYDAHEYYTETPEVARRPRVQKIWEAVARHCIPRIRYAYTVGAALQAVLSRRYGIDFGLIRNLPQRRSGGAGAKVQPPVILYQGVLNEGRGISEMLAALSELEGVQLWLAGEGDLSAELRAECTTRGLEERVRFWGYLPPEELAQLSPQASVGLNLLSDHSLNYYYSLANKTFDYLQAGVPALHRDFPEYRQLVETYDVGVLVPDLRVDSIVRAVRALLDDEERYRERVANCGKAAEQLTWEREASRLVAFYDRIVTESRTGQSTQ